MSFFFLQSSKYIRCGQNRVVVEPGQQPRADCPLRLLQRPAQLSRPVPRVLVEPQVVVRRVGWEGRRRGLVEGRRWDGGGDGAVGAARWRLRRRLRSQRGLRERLLALWRWIHVSRAVWSRCGRSGAWTKRGASFFFGSRWIVRSPASNFRHRSLLKSHSKLFLKSLAFRTKLNIFTSWWNETFWNYL